MSSARHGPSLPDWEGGGEREGGCAERIRAPVPIIPDIPNHEHQKICTSNDLEAPERYTTIKPLRNVTSHHHRYEIRNCDITNLFRTWNDHVLLLILSSDRSNTGVLEKQN
ncbi:hypothetical protein CEXT_760221 [Caerostris extrusa]|uniref:Uncharacterized protein n=1 Tax=Caerostris extrusa TaxID=172846 RepID=A0AAV4WNS1_CAEEX|nr:hypothetical protein CEXT_760221 [Caerostris extrusa]